MLELRLLGDNDVSLVEVWLNKEHVKRWYEIPHLGITIGDWMSEIKERNGEFQWLTYLIALWQGRPIGLCQYYKCVDSNEDFGTLPLIGSYGIDYLIGEESHLGQGFWVRESSPCLWIKFFLFQMHRELPLTLTKITRLPKRHCYHVALHYRMPNVAAMSYIK